MSGHCPRARRGLTRTDLITIVVILLLLVLLAGILMPALGVRRTSKQLKDSTHVRSLMQALYTWPQRGNDQFPLPSLLDRGDATIAGPAESKDTTANIVSILVQEGLVVPEQLVGPAETNPRIRVFGNYQFKNPAAAANPAKALWDPALSADFVSAKGGNISYAHMLPYGDRLKQWACNFDPEAVVLGNRGPEVASIAKNPDGSVAPRFAKPNSYTFLIHGSRTRWEGNIGFNDNHVDYLLSPILENKYTSTDAQEWPDALFYDEPDDADATNAFLGIFIKAGKERKDFVAIWD